MSKIVWDNTGERRYETGVDHGVLYVQNDQGAYPEGVAWNGLISVSENADGGDPNDLWADNIKYATLRGSENKNLSIEAYNYPPEFEECDGTKEAVAGVYVAQQPRKTFGMAYRTAIGTDTSPAGDTKYKLHLVYNASCSPSERSYETMNESPDAITFSWDVTTTPVAVTGYKPTALITIDSTKVDATKLATLEDELYGTEQKAAHLPSPNEVLGYLK